MLEVHCKFAGGICKFIKHAEISEVTIKLTKLSKHVEMRFSVLNTLNMY